MKFLSKELILTQLYTATLMTLTDSIPEIGLITPSKQQHIEDQILFTDEAKARKNVLLCFDKWSLVNNRRNFNIDKWILGTLKNDCQDRKWISDSHLQQVHGGDWIVILISSHKSQLHRFRLLRDLMAIWKTYLDRYIKIGHYMQIFLFSFQITGKQRFKFLKLWGDEKSVHLKFMYPPVVRSLRSHFCFKVTCTRK